MKITIFFLRILKRINDFLLPDAFSPDIAGRKLLACLLLFVFLSPTVWSEQGIAPDVSQEFSRQLVVDLAIETLQKVIILSTDSDDYVALQRKHEDISQQIQGIVAGGEQHYRLLSEQLGMIGGIIDFYLNPVNRLEKSLMTEKRKESIEKLGSYLRQQPVIQALQESGIGVLTADREINFDGDWLLVDTVQSGIFAGLEVGFNLRFQSSETGFEGRGGKVWENGVELPRKQQTPLVIYGDIKNNVARATFLEKGMLRELKGEFVWLAINSELLSGRFVSATGVSGMSLLRKVTQNSAVEDVDPDEEGAHKVKR